MGIQTLSKNMGKIKFFIVLTVVFASLAGALQVFAIDFTLDVSINSSNGQLTLQNTFNNNYISGVPFGDLFSSHQRLYSGQYPNTAGVIVNVYEPSRNWNSYNGTTMQDAGSGFSWFSVTASTTGVSNTGIVCAQKIASVWSTYDCGLPSASTLETRIESIIPPNNTIFSNTATTTGIDIGATWFVSNEDLDDLDTFFSDPSEKIHLVQSACPLNTDLSGVQTCVDVLVYNLPTGYEVLYSENFIESPRTHRKLSENTDYKLITDFYGSNYSGIFGDIFRISTTTYFTIGSTTASQNPEGLSGTVASTTVANMGLNSFIAASTACNPFSGEFSITDCLFAIVVPPQEVLDDQLTVLQDHALHIFPFGYITDFVSIVRSTSTVPLVILSATVPNGIPGSGADISLDLTNSLDFVLNATTSSFSNVSASSTETLGVITKRYWDYLVYLGVLLYILRRVLGSHIIPKMGHINHKT